jgi:hypothetical protein
MDFVRFVVPLKVNAQYGLNKIYSGKHWSNRKKIAEEIHELVFYSLKQQKIPRSPFDKPVGICISYNSKLDCDNHGYLTKMIVDALKGYLIEDDDRKHVKEIRQRFHSGKDVVVEVWEIDEKPKQSTEEMK